MDKSVWALRWMVALPFFLFAGCLPSTDGNSQETAPGEGATVAATATIEVVTRSGRFAVMADVAPLREGPGVTFERVGTLEQGEHFEIDAAAGDGDWYRLQESGLWVSAVFVQEVLETPTETPTGTMTVVPIDTPTTTTTPLPEATEPTATATATTSGASASETARPAPLPTNTPTLVVIDTPTWTPTAQPIDTPTHTPTATPVLARPTPTPSSPRPSPTLQRIDTPTPTPTRR